MEPNTQPTQSGARVSQGLNGVRERARKNKQERFTALLHHVSVDLLRESYYGLKRKAAPGVDGVTWKEYEIGLEDRLNDLHGRVHRGAYRALPSKRVYIPKANGKLRPLGIAALEDKIVQSAVVTVLNQITRKTFGASPTGSGFRSTGCCASIVPNAANNPADPVRAFCPAKPGGTWGRETGVVYFSGLSAYLCGEQSGKIRSPAHHGRRATAEETAGYPAEASPADARRRGANRGVPAKRTQRLLPIPCHSRQHTGAEAIPATGRPPMVSGAGTAQPAATHLGETGETFRSLATRTRGCS